MAKCATGYDGAGRPAPYGLKDQHALVVRGQTILAVIPESDIPSGHLTVSIFRVVWSRRA
jgi:hypothetical protein